MNDTDPRCKRCGQCCQYMFEGKLKICKYLKQRFDGLGYYCRARNKRNSQFRLGNSIVIERKKDKYAVCSKRCYAQFNYEGCPFNKKGNKTLKQYCKDKGVEM